jgi:hypothetical protein
LGDSLRESPSSERELRKGGFGRFNRRLNKMVNIVRTLFNLNKPERDENREIIERLDKISNKINSVESGGPIRGEEE